MELIHKINGRVIEEPVGFDNLELKIQRGEYHGISAEVSVGSLEFYGAAYSTIRSAYEMDIDLELQYTVETESGINIYTGVIDLSTCSFQDSEYRSVSVNVGEIGIKTTFNNRAETPVDLNSIFAMNGSLLAHRPHWWTVYLPTKQLVHTNRWSQIHNKTLVKPSTGGQWMLGEVGFYAPDKIERSEFGNTNADTTTDMLYDPDDLDEFRKKFGNDCRMSIDGKILVSVIGTFRLSSAYGDWTLMTDRQKPMIGSSYSVITPSRNRIIDARYMGDNVWKDYEMEDPDLPEIFSDVLAWMEDGPVGRSNGITIRCGLYSANNAVVYSETQFVPSTIGSSETIAANFELNPEILVSAEGAYRLGISINADYNVYNGSSTWNAIFREGSSIRLKMYDTIKLGATTTLAISAFDALEIIAQSITDNGINVKSGFYALPESSANPGPIGGGALKFITNGYKIRNVKENERSFAQSFKNVIEALDCIDCVGFGFSDEDGETVIRVERWDWFYQNNVILNCDGANNIRIDVDASRIPAVFSIGYKKYGTSSDYDAIDTIHGERTFTRNIKAVSGEIRKECEWVADNYTIEEARRSSSSLDKSEESSYDDLVFVFEMMRLTGYNYAIAKSAYNISGLDRPDELINAMLTPRHCAARWRDWLFSANSPQDFKFSTGKENSNASFSVLQTDGTDYYLQSFAERNPQNETDTITRERASYRAETITFEYPISIEQYNAVKSNPYGLVVVNGIPGWIQEMNYKVNEGLATIKLIPKYVG